MVCEAVEKCAGEPFRPEDRGLFIEWQVARHQRGAAFVALAEYFEEQLGTDRRERHVAQFVDDQQLDRVEMFLQGPQTAFVAGSHEFMDGESFRLATSKKAQRRPGHGQNAGPKTLNEGDPITEI